VVAAQPVGVAPDEVLEAAAAAARAEAEAALRPAARPLVLLLERQQEPALERVVPPLPREVVAQRVVAVLVVEELRRAGERRARSRDRDRGDEVVAVLGEQLRDGEVVGVAPVHGVGPVLRLDGVARQLERELVEDVRADDRRQLGHEHVPRHVGQRGRHVRDGSPEEEPARLGRHRQVVRVAAHQLPAVVHLPVHPEDLLPRVLVVGPRLLEAVHAEVGRRPDAEQPHRVRVALGRRHVVRVGRVVQPGRVDRRRERRGGRARDLPPLVRPEAEQLVAQHGPAQRVAEVVVLQLRRSCRDVGVRALVPRPAVRVEPVAPEVLVARRPEDVAAPLGHDVDDAAAAAGPLGAVA
jgi:hypothetical protein